MLGLEQEIAWVALPVTLFVLGVPLWQRVAKKKDVRLQRWWIKCAFMFFFSIFSGAVFGFGGALLSRVPVKHILHSAHCRIMSKDVDIRSSKACHLGDLSPLSLKLFGIPSLHKFQCSLDYYWVSVFEVELMPHYSNNLMQTVSEIPKEVLPSSCRPSFTDVWRVKESFQVNKSYPCFYTLTRGTYQPIFTTTGHTFYNHCKLQSPSILKLFRDYIILIMNSYNLKQSTVAGNMFWKGMYAIIIGLVYSILVTLFTKAVSWLLLKFIRPDNCTTTNVFLLEARLQLSSLILAMSLGVILLTINLEELRYGLEAGLRRFFYLR